MNDKNMQSKQESHTLKKHLETKGMIVRGWIRMRGLPVHLAPATIYNGFYHRETVEALREDGLYEYLTPRVRDKIERAETLKGGNSNE